MGISLFRIDNSESGTHGIDFRTGYPPDMANTTQLLDEPILALSHEYVTNSFVSRKFQNLHYLIYMEQFTVLQDYIWLAL